MARPARDLPHGDRGHPIRQPLIGRSERSPLPPSFWSDLGPFLPPRNAYLLLRNTVYFDGHGIGQPLAVLLAYVAVAGALLVVFHQFIDRARSAPAITDAEADSAVVLAPVGPPP